MAEDTGTLTDLSRRFAERQSRFREAMGTEGGGRELTLEQILAWADAHHTAHGTWPEIESGEVAGTAGESWRSINHSLALGLRGLQGDSSLAELLAEHRGVPLPDMGPKALADKIWAWEQEQFPVKGPKGRSRRAVRDCPRLSVEQILAWADAHEAATGDWPACKAGKVCAAPFDVSWRAIDCALRRGFRGLSGGSSLAQLRSEYRDFRPPLSVEQILVWADAHHAAHGSWPKYLSGDVLGAPGETWTTLDLKLSKGGRGLPGGLSLARLLAEHRGIRHGHEFEPLSVEKVLAWADAYHAAHGRWPDYQSGQVDPARRQTWCAINSALIAGRHGLPGDTTLARLLLEYRGPEATNRPLRISVERVLAWADAHHAATGRWPRTGSGPVTEAPDITWAKISGALFAGTRGLPRGSSVPQLLAEHRGVFQRRKLPNLTVDQILAWADAYRAIHHCWPRNDSGIIPGTPDETWDRIDRALWMGRRGLPRKLSLKTLIFQHRCDADAQVAECGLSRPEAEHRGAPLLDMSPKALAQKIRAWEQANFPARPRRRTGSRPSCPSLTIDAILAWADAYHRATGNWPTPRAGRVQGAPFDLTWQTIDSALRNGNRGLSGGQTLLHLLFEHRDVSGRRPPRPVSVEQILAWVDDFRSRHGSWPKTASGAIPGAPGERWSAIDHALQAGRYGLPGGITLRRLIAEHRDPDNCLQAARLTVEQILAWMDAHRASTGRWPTAESGQVRGASPGLTWRAVVGAVRHGHRGLPVGLTWAGLRSEYREPRPELTVERILAWADAHHAARGCWPACASGRIEETSRETWSIVNSHLVRGGRGLPGGQNLAQLLVAHRGARIKENLPSLRVDQILAWADAHHAAHGAWPTCVGGRVDGAPGERWQAIHRALELGWRGLPGGTKLSQLLAEHGRIPARTPAPGLTVDQILAWADAHHNATGEWPTRKSGVITGTQGEKWSGVCDALKRGRRGLPRTGSLAELLSSRRQFRNRANLPPLSIEQILLWADEHYAASGRWPTNMSGRVGVAPEESWGSIALALASGHRGFPGGTTLSRLLAAHRPTKSSPLTLEIVRSWADAHRRVTGFWPTKDSGPVLAVAGESWASIDRALHLGLRGLPGGPTLARLLGTSRDPSPKRPRTSFTLEQIRIWAKRHREITGQWPTANSGLIEGAPGEDWSRVAKALKGGTRGLKERITLAEFIRRDLDPSVPSGKQRLTIEEILAWADLHQARTGRWPGLTSGAVPAEPGLTWGVIDNALRKGCRGVGPGSSVRKLFLKYRSKGPTPAPGAGHER